MGQGKNERPRQVSAACRRPCLHTDAQETMQKRRKGVKVARPNTHHPFSTSIFPEVSPGGNSSTQQDQGRPHKYSMCRVVRLLESITEAPGGELFIGYTSRNSSV
ncbi:uncharacterized protein [Fopius arisanus]|uniref:PLEKHG1_0 protein n=1 Tax=Fopius arisanus TaxID=64838 RepID=A0A0C9S314_9HYME|nr:PREDICTED: uncharacterized protein LOC105271671 isoform X3 [Fopius arisanus]